MPFQYDHKTVAVRLEEVVPRFWNHLNSLQKELQRYKEKSFGIKRVQIGGNGRELLIDFDSLPENIRTALGDPRKTNHPLERYFEFDPEALRYYGKFERAGNGLKPEEQDKYVINASVLNALAQLEQERIRLRISMKNPSPTKGLIESLRTDAESFQNSLLTKYQCQHTLPASGRFKEAYRAYKSAAEPNEAYYTLIKDPEGKAVQNARKVDNQIEMLLNAIFQNQSHKPTPTDVSKQYAGFLSGYVEVYNADTGELYDPKDFKKLSPSTVINYLNKWENKIATHGKRSANRQVYMNTFKPHHQMDLPELAGSMISIDDRQPPFWYDKGQRAWFYIGMDVASHCITTVVYGKSKEGLIVDFYREMVRQYAAWGYNLPLELECESSLNSSFRNTLLRPGAMFENVRIEANNARGKYIERAFGSLRYEVEKEAFGWIGRPHAKREANQTAPGQNTIIPFDQLIEARMHDLATWNNMPHPENPEISRWDYFTQRQNPETKPTNWEAILPVIGHKTESSCKLGFVNLQGKKRAIAKNGQILTGESLIKMMKVLEGKSVDVYWLDAKDQTVLKALVYQDNRLICEVMEMPRYNRAIAERTPECHAAYTLQSSYVATVEAFGKSQKNKIENVQIIDRIPKTVNSNFSFSNMPKPYKPTQEAAHVYEDDQEDDLVMVPVSRPSWRDNFTI